MTQENAIVAIYSSHTTVQEAVAKLRRSGFDTGKVSVAGRDHEADEAVVGSKFALIVHGSLSETLRAKEILKARSAALSCRTALGTAGAAAGPDTGLTEDCGYLV